MYTGFAGENKPKFLVMTHPCAPFKQRIVSTTSLTPLRPELHWGGATMKHGSTQLTWNLCASLFRAPRRRYEALRGYAPWPQPADDEAVKWSRNKVPTPATFHISVLT